MASRDRELPAQGPVPGTASLGTAGPGPALEDRYLLGGPGAVAGHRAVADPVQDGRGISADVGVGPQVEDKAHRLAILVPEQRLDVLSEAHRLVRAGQHGLVGRLHRSGVRRGRWGGARSGPGPQRRLWT